LGVALSAGKIDTLEHNANCRLMVVTIVGDKEFAAKTKNPAPDPATDAGN
jgi:hypothetical protein